MLLIYYSDPRIDDKYRCTSCGEKRVKSVCYCASCDKQLCENHEQVRQNNVAIQVAEAFDLSVLAGD